MLEPLSHVIRFSLRYITCLSTTMSGELAAEKCQSDIFGYLAAIMATLAVEAY